MGSEMCIRDRGVPALGVPEGLVNLCPALVTVPGVPTLGAVDVANLGPCPEVVIMLGEVVRMPVVGVPALGVPEGLVNLCPALVTVLGVLARGMPEGLVNLCPALVTVLGALARGIPEGLVNLCPALVTVLGVVARGMPEGLVKLCPALVTVLGALALAVVDIANLGPCPEVVTTLGDVVLMPANLCAVLVTVACGAENL